MRPNATAASSDSHLNLPLRWESTGDRWWFASPIDWAAANGHYDLVRELLRLDANHLISLTSLRRLRRLESVWDDSAVRSRSTVARRLLHDLDAANKSEEKDKKNPLLRGGCGGWLLYTAASAGDVGFVREVLGRNPLLVFGEGEYGLTDVLYAAARSRSAEVFWVLYDYAVSPRFGGEDEVEKRRKDDGKVVASEFKWEVMNRAVHAAARGGNLEVLVELLGSGGDVLAYRDVYGSTLLHAAAGKGQVEVAKHLISSYDSIITATDNEGNTALHVAAYKGQLPVLEELLHASPSSISMKNNAGNTLLHMAVSGALSPGFRRVDQQIELVKHLVLTRTDSFDISEIINAKNDEGRTALHMAIIGNVHSDLIEHLMTARFANVNLRDNHGWTPLDYLRQHPRSNSSEILIRRLISAGGMSNCQDYSTRRAIADHIKMQGKICSSPGTTFRVLDSEIFTRSGIRLGLVSTRLGHHRGVSLAQLTPDEISECGSNNGGGGGVGGDSGDGDGDGDGEEHNVISNSTWVDSKKPGGGHVNNAAKRFKTMFQWPKMIRKKKKSFDYDDDDFAESKWGGGGGLDETPISLRERFSKPTTSLSNNKRTLAVRSNISSPTNRKKFASGAVRGALEDLPQLKISARSSSSSISKLSLSSYNSMEKGKGAVPVVEEEMASTSYHRSRDNDDVEVDTPSWMQKQGSTNKRSVNQYLCFGGKGLSVKNPIGRHQRNLSLGSKQSIQLAA